VIESQVLIGAGSLVPPNKRLESGYLYLGNPVKKVRPSPKITDEEKAYFKYSAEHYMRLAVKHKAGVLKSSTEKGNRDGDIIIRKINAFLDEKAIPKEKKDLISRTLENTLTTENINKVHDGESQLKRVFTKIVDDLGYYYKIGLTTDFTGKLFNEMYGWLGFTQDKLNDVVLTPSYVATLLVKLARVNKDSYVWDFATGSAGLLVAAMNEMLIDAKQSITSPEELYQKEVNIKAQQLLGLELLSSVYMLAVLNMILMGDGSSNILNKDSIKDFDGKYGFGSTDSIYFLLMPLCLIRHILHKATA
jgi:type I restriction-modification system DNA methylase subunit